MKHLLVALLFPLLMRGCDGFSLAPVIPGAVTPTLALYDLFGRSATVFRSGQDFDMRLTLTNMSRQDLCYSYTAPEVIFTILLGDSVVATSLDGMAFVQVIVGGCIRQGETQRSHWIAPNSPGRSPPIALLTGVYTAKVSHAAFRDPRVAPPRPVRFTVVR